VAAVSTEIYLCGAWSCHGLLGLTVRRGAPGLRYRVGQLLDEHPDGLLLPSLPPPSESEEEEEEDMEKEAGVEGGESAEAEGSGASEALAGEQALLRRLEECVFLKHDGDRLFHGGGGADGEARGHLTEATCSRVSSHSQRGCYPRRLNTIGVFGRGRAAAQLPAGAARLHQGEREVAEPVISARALGRRA
jgi:hypothetical protein